MNTVVRITACLMLASGWMCSGVAQTITIKGSDTLLGLSQKWADAYKAKHPEVVLQVAGGGAPAAFAALADKKLDIVLASRAIRFKEAEPIVAAFGQRPTECKVAVSGLVVYVNANNPVNVLTYDELFGIFKGKHTNWKELGGGDLAISVYAQETNSVHGELFGEEVLNGKGISAEVRMLAASDILKAIAKDPKGIGYGALMQLEGVRPLSIKRAFSSTPVAPSEEAIANRIYPISRFVYCYTAPTGSKDETKAYLDWVRGDEGQRIAREAGYYPLPAKWRPSQ
jgi:phosphate transport system substrate-binding protein